MKKQLNLLDDKPTTIFFHYLTNAVIGSMSGAIYVLFDTIFIGQGVGQDGLAALNIGIPIFNIMNALGMLLGVGGATSMGVLKGQGEKEKSKDFFAISCIAGIIITIIGAIFGTVFIDKIIYLLGSDDSIFKLTKDYLQPLMVFGGIYLFSYMLQIYVRNDGNPKLPMIAGVISGILNTILDAIFIFKFHWGMKGAIIATIISTVIGVLILLLHFKGDRCELVFKVPTDVKDNFLRIVKNGLPSFILEASSGLIIVLFNNRLIRLLGVDGVTAYSIIANVNYIMLAVFYGTAQAIQPAISINIGALKIKRATEFLKLGIITCVTCGTIFALAGFLFSDYIVYLFLNNPSANVIALSSIAIQIYFLAYCFGGSNVVGGMFLQAGEKAKLSTTISMLRGVILTVIGMYLLPFIFGVNGIWATVVFAEVITLFFTAIFILNSIKKFKQI